MTDVALERYRMAQRRYAAAEADVHRAADARALAVADLLDLEEWTVRGLAAELDISHAQVQKLAERGRSVRETAPDR
jgi:hypothetical protein